jgi:hypothetical protein
MEVISARQTYKCDNLKQLFKSGRLFLLRHFDLSGHADRKPSVLAQAVTVVGRVMLRSAGGVTIHSLRRDVDPTLPVAV